MIFAVGLMLVGLVVAASVALSPGTQSGDGPTTGESSPDAEGGASDGRNVPDPDYDDGWVADFPQTIGGLNLTYIDTPKNRACLSLPIIHLQASQSSLEDFLASQPDISSLNTAVQSVPGAPAKVRLSFSRGLIDKETAAANTAIRNQERLENGCLPVLDDFEDGAPNDPNTPPEERKPERGFAVYQNKDAGRYTNDNGQSVKIRAPSGIGTDQDLWSAALNNVLTDDDYFMQSGMLLKVGRTEIIYAEDHGDLEGEEFTQVSYSAGTLFQFKIIRNDGSWMMCAGNDEDIENEYQCVTSAHATGSNLKKDVATSVFFENANTSSNWNSGFPAAITVSHAKIIRDGVAYNWGTEDRRTIHTCGDGQYPVTGAMGDYTLKNNTIAYWLMSGIPLYCP